MKYLLLNTQHADYNNIIASQTKAFNAEKGATNFTPVLNLDGTQALIKAFGAFDSTCGCIIDPNFDPSTRDMTKWEKPLKLI